MRLLSARVHNLPEAEPAGLTVKDGIAVDEHLCTDHPDIDAAGDVAVFYPTRAALGVSIQR